VVTLCVVGDKSTNEFKNNSNINKVFDSLEDSLCISHFIVASRVPGHYFMFVSINFNIYS
jgi:hypothetical protein